MQQETENCQISLSTAPASRGRWTWWGWGLWLPGCLIFGTLLAWASFEFSGRFSPLFFYPLMVGLLLGASLVALVRLGQMGHRPTAWLALILTAGIVIGGQHYFSYREASAQSERETVQFTQARAAFGDLVQGQLPSPPDNLFDYLRDQALQGRPLDTVFGPFVAQGAFAWLSWALDGLLILLPAVVMMAIALRRPFCGQCGSWRVTRRAGPLDGPTARRVAEMLEMPHESDQGVAYYRLTSCNQGCAPTGFSLSWQGSGKAEKLQTVWLDDEQRNQVVKILDQSRDSRPSVS